MPRLTALPIARSRGREERGVYVASIPAFQITLKRAEARTTPQPSEGRGCPRGGEGCPTLVVERRLSEEERLAPARRELPVVAADVSPRQALRQSKSLGVGGIGVVLFQQVFAEIIFQIAPNRMHVVGF